ncbi:formyltransferase family protein [Endozoicomonas acroporae]|uniref:formyltransferase family protein n=1 Tax=Endozoicomonas acroporae TaxID=1701104 RepID=UPI0013D2C78E|nr:formyltransferase family protein [Endozoicomonas acroporae]
MQKIKVVFLGSRLLGFEVLELLLGYRNIEIVGCITKERFDGAWWDKDPYDIRSCASCLTLKDLEFLDFDFGVSINFWQIIPKSIIDKGRLGFINLHHSYNLSYRGRDMTSHVIRNARNKKQFYHGTTLHYLDEGLDTGPIISTKACEISEYDTAWSLFNKVEALGLDLLKEWLPRLVISRAVVAYPEVGQPLSFRGALNKQLNSLTGDKLMIYDFVRSSDFNNFYEPAFYIDNEGGKVYLTTDNKFAGEVIVDAGNGRVVYKNIEFPVNK